LTDFVESAGKTDRIGDRIIEYGILALIVFSPLPAASVFDWSELVIELGTLSLTAVYILSREKIRPDPLGGRPMKWPGRLWLGFILFLVLQVLPLPGALVQVLSPEAFARKSPYAGGRSAWMTLSVVPDRTLREGLLLLSCFLLGFLIVRTVRHRSQILRMASVLVGMGVFEALYGLLELYDGSPRILFYQKSYNLDSVTGTFVNRNHLSGYLEMIIPLAIGMIVSRMNLFSSSRLKLREKVLRFSEKNFLTNVALFLSVLVMGLGVVFSKSRSGVVIFVLIFLVFFGGTLLIRERFGYHKRAIVTSLQALFILTLGISLYVGINATVARFAMDKFLREQRPAFWAETLRQFSRFPLFGTGLGTFPSVYPGSEENGVLMHIYHAHNDYLEYLSELGVLGTLLLFSAVFSMLFVAFRTWRKRRHPEVRGLAFGGFVSILAILLHSLTDFNMKIPANLLLFSVVLSLTAAIVNSKRETGVDRRQQGPLTGGNGRQA